jgi:hypothetical protein
VISTTLETKPLSVAILGWGSLILNPPDSNLTDEDRLRISGCWHSDGPILPLEFSRVDEEGRLLLVVDVDHGRSCQVSYTLSAFTTVEEAVSNLQAHEKIPSRNDIHVARKSVAASDNVCAGIVKWMEEHHFDAAIWVGAGNNFQEKTGRPFTTDNAINHLDSLPCEQRAAAMASIAKVPESVETPLSRTVRTRESQPVTA